MVDKNTLSHNFEEVVKGEKELLSLEGNMPKEEHKANGKKPLVLTKLMEKDDIDLKSILKFVKRILAWMHG